MRRKRNAAWSVWRPGGARALVAAQVAERAETPLVKPELPKAPVQPDWRVKDEAIKAEHEKKYNAEYEKWLERKKYYDETEYPAYKAERLRRAAAEAAQART